MAFVTPVYSTLQAAWCSLHQLPVLLLLFVFINIIIVIVVVIFISMVILIIVINSLL